VWAAADREPVEPFTALPAAWLLESDAFVAGQQLVAVRRPLAAFRLVLFASHRWETLAHPDPSGHQHAALAALLRELRDVAAALLSAAGPERVALVPALDRHGTLQAVVALHRLLAAMPESEAPGSADDLLALVGVWYDYACLPQSPRTTAEETEFRTALIELPGLIERDGVSLIALRQAGDDYEGRGWCLAEATLTASGARTDRALALRIDRFGRPLALARSTELSEGIATAFARWRDPQGTPREAADGAVLAGALVGHMPDELFAEEDGIQPTGVTRAADRSSVWQALAITNVMGAGGERFDLAERLRELASREGVACAADNDLVYVMLVMLTSRAAAGTQARAFFEACVERHVGGDPLLVEVESPATSSEEIRWSFAARA
jgi:hypothetical protein